jgi:hypothetical protein
LGIAVFALVLVALFVWGAKAKIAQMPADEMSTAPVEIFFNALVLLGCLFGCAYAYFELRANPETITIGDDWVELPGTEKIHASTIDRVVQKKGLFRNKLEVHLKREHRGSRTKHVVYPRDFGVATDVDSRLLSIWEQNKVADSTRFSLQASETRFYYTCGTDGVPLADGMTRDQVLELLHEDSPIRSDLDEEWSPLSEHPDFRESPLVKSNPEHPPNLGVAADRDPRERGSRPLNTDR